MMRLIIVFILIITLMSPALALGDKDCQGMCGDASGDGRVNISDVVYIINFVFKDGPDPQPVMACGDANWDGGVNISDAVFLIHVVFFHGVPMPSDCHPGVWDDWGGDCCPFVPSD